MSVLDGVRCDEGKTQRGGQRRASSPRHMQGIRKTPADVRPLFVSVVSHRDQSDRAEFGDEPQDLLAVHDDEQGDIPLKGRREEKRSRGLEKQNSSTLDLL